MAKKLLSETVVRRFAQLANLSPVNEMNYGMKRDDEEEKVEEAMDSKEDEEKMEEGMYAEEEADMADAEEPPAEMPEEEPEMDMGGEEEMELTDEEAQAIIDLGKKLEAAMGPGDMDMDMGDKPEMDMGGDEEMPPVGEEDEIMEALEGIKYVPEQKEIVEEVARRVAKRLLRAKRAQAELSEALGSRKTNKKK